MRLLLLVVALALALALTTSAYYADFASPNATAFAIKEDNLNCRLGPATSFRAIKQYSTRDSVRVVCQRRGMVIAGNYVWNLTPDGCYVADYYVATGIYGIWTAECNATRSEASAQPPSGLPPGVGTTVLSSSAASSPTV